MQVIDLNLYLNATLPQVIFKHFATKNQPLGFYISGTLVENGLSFAKTKYELTGFGEGIRRFS